MTEQEIDDCYDLAGNYFENGDYSLAISECSSAISLGAKDARIFNTRAYAYIKQGEGKKARLDFDASLILDPNDDWVREMRDKLVNKGY
ncbi:MAG: tetratricopeptide repeat protein [Treponema sp.]|jgi:Flp pilus assembly protein TadD|nr:tetratricopeptide repeat protein [Treponema sp.]